MGSAGDAAAILQQQTQEGGVQPLTQEELVDLLVDRITQEDLEEATATTPAGPTATRSQYATVGSENIEENIRSRSVGRFRQEDQRVIQSTIRRYIDVPTADEFLDDWDTGMNTYVQGLVQTGQLSQFDAGLAQDLSQEFLGEYLGELGRRAQAGEDIFRVTNFSTPEQYLGTRTGAVETERGRGTSRTTGVETEDRQTGTTSQAQGRTTSAVTTQPTGTPPGVAAAQSQFGGGTSVGDIARAAASAAPVTDTGETTSQDTTRTQRGTRSRAETDTQTQYDDITRTRQTEQIFARPNIAVVSALSPAAYLQGRFKDPGALATVLRGRAGGAYARQTRGASGVVSGATRT